MGQKRKGEPVGGVGLVGAAKVGSGGTEPVCYGIRRVNKKEGRRRRRREKLSSHWLKPVLKPVLAQLSNLDGGTKLE